MTHIKVVGITGGVGAGKSSVLAILENIVSCRVLYADLLAKELQEKGGGCYGKILALLGKGILAEDGSIDRKKEAELIYRDEELRKKVNAVIHPAVTERILKIIEEERRLNRVEYLFIEAALLIENGYDKICDELWYIYASEETRRSRLKASRGYSDEKISGIFASQLPEEEYRRACSFAIDNNGTEEETRGQLLRVFNKQPVIRLRRDKGTS